MALRLCSAVKSAHASNVKGCSVKNEDALWIRARVQCMLEFKSAFLHSSLFQWARETATVQIQTTTTTTSIITTIGCEKKLTQKALRPSM